LDFVYLLLFVWACIFLGLWIIGLLIVPLKLGLPGLIGEVLASIFKVAASSLLVLIWLWIWKEIAKRMFWRIMKRQQRFINTNGT